MVCLLFISLVTHHHVQFKSWADTVDSTNQSRPTRQQDRPDGCPRPPHTRYHYPRPKCHLKSWRVAGHPPWWNHMELVVTVMVKHSLAFQMCIQKDSETYQPSYIILFTWIPKTSQHEKTIRIGMIPSDFQCQGNDCTNTLTRSAKRRNRTKSTAWNRRICFPQEKANKQTSIQWYEKKGTCDMFLTNIFHFDIPIFPSWETHVCFGCTWMTQLICTTATTVSSCDGDANFGSWIPTLHTMIPGVRDIETTAFSSLRRPN